jgi:hypothetical protein
MRDLVRALRNKASYHDDTAWLHPRPNAQRRPVPSLSQDLLDAIGIVGLATPRPVGETHLLRALAHLVHGPVRHLVIDDATLLPTYVLDELHQAALIAGVQLWVVIDTADQPSARGTGRTRDQHATDILAWVHATSIVIAPAEVLARWTSRPRLTPNCQPPTHAWWHTPLNPHQPYATACTDHQAAPDQSSTANVDCLLAGMRRALTAGTVTPATARARLIEATEHPDTTVADRWALTAAGRDLYTPGMDALHQTQPAATTAVLADVAPDGSTLTHNETTTMVDPMRRPALARLHSSRRLAGCLPTEPIDGIFDQEPGTPSPRRRHTAPQM